MDINKKTIRTLILGAVGCIVLYWLLHETERLAAVLKVIFSILSPFIVGAALAFGLEWLLYDALVGRINSIDTLQLFNFVPFQQLLLPMIVTFAAAGLFVGVVGSWTSIRKFMNV